MRERNILNNAPIAIFGFNRPEHLRECLKSLERCEGFEKQVGYIFIDGPRNSSEASKVNEVISVAREFANIHSFELILREENLGLAKSVRSGIDMVFEKFDRIIVIEDDLILAVGFLNFINLGLEKYFSETKVASISGYQYPLSEALQKISFLRGADCWGWGTWKNRWEAINFKGSELLEQIYASDLIQELNLNGSVDYEDMLIKYCNSEIDSWAVPWHVSNFLQNKLTLYPSLSYVSNEGGDGSGTHFGNNFLFSQELNKQESINFPSQVCESKAFKDSLISFYSHSKKRGSKKRKARKLLATIYRSVLRDSPKH